METNNGILGDAMKAIKAREDAEKAAVKRLPPIAKMTADQAYEGLVQLRNTYLARIGHVGSAYGFVKAAYFRNKARYEARIAELAVRS